MKQQTIDKIHAVIAFCKEPRLRAEIARHIDVTLPMVTFYTRAAKDCFDIVKTEDKRGFNHLWTVQANGTPFNMPAKVTKGRPPVYLNKPRFELDKPELPNLALWGFTDHRPPKGHEYTEHENYPMPLRPMPKNAVQGNTLSFI